MCLLAFGLAFAALPIRAGEAPRRIFLLEGLTPTQPAVEQTVQAFKQRLRERTSEDIEVYTDFLDLGRFRGPEADDRMVRFLSGKFSQVRPDLIVPISRGATTFMAQHRDEIAPGVPIVYCCTPISDTLHVPPDIPGVAVEYDWVGTLALAQRLQPNATTLVLVSGAADIERAWEREAARQLQPFMKKYDTRYLVNVRHDEVLKEVSRLPRDSIVILMPIFGDDSARTNPTEIATDIAKASSAPAYSPVATLFGGGIVGGNMDSYIGQGAKAADLALDILSGKDPSTLPHQTKLPLQTRVDARQLERWGFAKASLPAGASVEFKQPTLWEEYRDTIVLVLLAFAVQVGIIALLLIEVRKRREAEKARKTAEAEADLQRRELTHIMRVATIGELSGGIAHELGQPLAAILANAQAAQALLAHKNHDMEAIGEILEEIVQEDSRAGQVIHRLRRLLRKGEHQSALVSLNDLIMSTLRLLHSELGNRKVRVETELKIDLPPISGDSVQLQQVLLNLMMNAMEAMASTPPSRRTLSICTRTTEEGYAEVSITDCGPGMSPDELGRLFEPFFTTKERGLGLGLSICSTIVRSHRGRLNLSNASGGGVTAIVSVPLPLHLAAAS